MQDKKPNPESVFLSYLKLFGGGSFLSHDFGRRGEPKSYGHIGHGIEMVLADDIDEKYLRDNYCYLYKDGVKQSDELFRQGGLFSPFKENKKYCSLLYYPDFPKSTMAKTILLNSDCEIAYEQKGNCLSYPYYLGGEIVVEDKSYYNILTGDIIVKGYQSIRSEKFLFVENTYDKDFETGVYKIEYETGNYEIFK
jgi:hypothetical protein